MSKLRPRIPVSLIIAVVVLLILGAIAGPIIRSLVTPEEMQTNVLFSAIPFVLIFVAIILAFIAVIVFAARLLNHNIPAPVYHRIESVLIAGIVMGVVGMFQPWLQILYKFGFLVLLVSTLAFILWSHIVPQGVRRTEELSSVSISSFEKRELGGGSQD